MVAEQKPQLTFRVKLFGYFREIAGNKEVTVPVDREQTTVADLKLTLTSVYPNLASAKTPYIVAVNRKVAQDSAPVSPTDEIAVLPLVSGG